MNGSGQKSQKKSDETKTYIESGNHPDDKNYADAMNKKKKEREEKSHISLHKYGKK